MQNVPPRLQEENRGHMYLLNMCFAAFTKLILSQTKTKIYSVMKHVKNPSFDKISAEIIKDTDNTKEFIKVFKELLIDMEFDEDILNDSLIKLNKMFVKGLISKAIWSIISNTDYKREAIPLRTQCLYEKIRSKNKGQQKLQFGQI